MWDTAGLPLKPVAGSTALHGCPTFAPAYVGRKRWAKPYHSPLGGFSLTPTSGHNGSTLCHLGRSVEERFRFRGGDSRPTSISSNIRDFPGATADLHSAPPDFPSKPVALINIMRFFLRKKPHAWSLPAARSRKSGYAPVEMTKGRVFMTRSSDLGNRNRRSVHALRSVEKHFHERTAAPQISPLRFAPVEMTKGRAVLPGTVVAESWACDPPKVMKNGSNHCGKPMRCLSSAKRGSAWRPFRRESVVR